MIIKCAVEHTLIYDRVCHCTFRNSVHKRKVHEWKYELEKVIAKSETLRWSLYELLFFPETSVSMLSVTGLRFMYQ